MKHDMISDTLASSCWRQLCTTMDERVGLTVRNTLQCKVSVAKSEDSSLPNQPVTRNGGVNNEGQTEDINGHTNA